MPSFLFNHILHPSRRSSLYRKDLYQFSLAIRKFLLSRVLSATHKFLQNVFNCFFSLDLTGNIFESHLFRKYLVSMGFRISWRTPSASDRFCETHSEVLDCHLFVKISEDSFLKLWSRRSSFLFLIGLFFSVFSRIC